MQDKYNILLRLYVTHNRIKQSQRVAYKNRTSLHRSHKITRLNEFHPLQNGNWRKKLGQSATLLIIEVRGPLGTLIDPVHEML